MAEKQLLLSFALQSCNRIDAFVLQHIFKLLQNFHMPVFKGVLEGFLDLCRR